METQIKTLGIFVGRYQIFEAGIQALKYFHPSILRAFEDDQVDVNNLVSFEARTGDGMVFGWKKNEFTHRNWYLNWEWALGLRDGWSFYVVDPVGTEISDHSPLRKEARFFGWLELYSDFKKRLPQIKPQVALPWLADAELYYKGNPRTVTSHRVEGWYWKRRDLIIAESFNTYINRSGARYELPAVVVYDEPASYTVAQTSEESIRWLGQVAFVFNEIVLSGIGQVPMMADTLKITSPVWLYQHSSQVAKAIELLAALNNPATYRAQSDATIG